MKQQDKWHLFVYPRKKPKTILALHKWHRWLLNDCIKQEFEKRALETGIRQINEDIKKYVGLAKVDATKNSARLALRHLNLLKKKWEEQLFVVKRVVKILHDTNEMIIANLLKAHIGEAYMAEVASESTLPGSNLLHEPGWLFEVSCAEILEKKRHAGFVTFGTVFDQKKIDVMAFPNPRRRIEWKGKQPSIWKADKK